MLRLNDAAFFLIMFHIENTIKMLISFSQMNL